MKIQMFDNISSADIFNAKFLGIDQKKRAFFEISNEEGSYYGYANIKSSTQALATAQILVSPIGIVSMRDNDNQEDWKVQFKEHIRYIFRTESIIYAVA